jgi:exodeoxyribonuclease V beta subunit
MNSLDPLTLELKGTHLIEASAGTGKTYTIAALYVRLILGHKIETPLMPQSILVVTFTDAATEELRDRIRTRLSESAQYFRGQIQSEDKFLIELRNDYDEKKWNWCAKNLEVAANYMDEAAVFTIHSWCNRMLQQHAFDSGSPFKQDVNTDDTELLNNVIRDYWRVHFYNLGKSQCEFIIKNVATSPDDFSGKIKALLSETEALKLDDFQVEFAEIFQEWIEWKKDSLELEKIAKESWRNDSLKISTLLTKATNESWLNANSYPTEKTKSRLSEIDQWSENKATIEIDAIEKFGILKLEKGLKKDFKKYLNDFSFLAFQAIDDFVNHGHIEQANNIVIQIKLHAIKWIRNRYAQEKKKLSRVTFDDMLSNLDNSLQGKNASRLGEIIRNQYPVALIDEFQDTDPIQYRIFSTIYKNSSSSCFLIGDPKQAIYSFRGADIYTYLKAHHKIPKENHHTLKTNFRSTQALVDAINQLFSQAEKNNDKGAFRFGNAENNPLPFVKVDAKGKEDNWCINNQIAPALTFWHWEEDKISIADYREQMAKVTASEIVKLLLNETAGFESETGFEKLELKDIAILVRNRNEAKIIRRELNHRNLKSVYLSEQDSIYDTDEANDVLIWLQAMANPRDERKVRTALSTETLNFSKEELYLFTSDELQWETHLDRFQTYQTRWQESGILPALRLLIHDYSLHLSLNDENESERKLTNVLHLAELLQQHSSKIEGEEALIHHFSQLLESKNNRSAKGNIIRLESDANLIKIITIHKSKGLEYPLVFLPFVSDIKEIKQENYFKYHNENSDLCIDLDNEHKNQHIEEQLQEDLRILYVAVTRAQYACWLGIASIDRLEKSAIGHLIKNISNLETVKGQCNSIGIVNLPDPSNDKFISPTQNDSKSTVRESIVNTRENWWAASYSALKHDYKKQSGEEAEPATAQENTHADDDDDNKESSVEASENSNVYALPKGAKPGVLIHSLFEKCGDYGFAFVHKNQDWRTETIKNIFSDNLWNNEKRIVIDNALPTWLEMPLVENARFIDLAKSSYKNELEFLIGADFVDVETLDSLITQSVFNNEQRPALEKNQLNGFLKGFIDLVFCHENKYYILDYKFNHLGNSAEDYNEIKIREAMLKHRYDLQFSLYLLALHRLLKIRLGDSYDYDTHIGGAIYVFLRANAKISNKPSREFIEQLDTLFLGENHG